MMPREPLSPVTIHALVVSLLSCLLAFALMPMLVSKIRGDDWQNLPAVTATFLNWRPLILFLPLIAAAMAFAESKMPRANARRHTLWFAGLMVNAAALVSIGWLIVAVYVLIVPAPL